MADIKMTYQILKQRSNLAASRLLILASNKQVASKLNQMPVLNGATYQKNQMEPRVHDTQ